MSSDSSDTVGDTAGHQRHIDSRLFHHLRPENSTRCYRCSFNDSFSVSSLMKPDHDFVTIQHISFCKCFSHCICQPANHTVISRMKASMFRWWAELNNVVDGVMTDHCLTSGLMMKFH